MTDGSSNIREQREEEDIAFAQDQAWEQAWGIHQILFAYQLPPAALGLVETGSAGTHAWRFSTRTREDHYATS